ncbi:MAG TPA: class I SAM-dependent rRNA methyltransferase, partial [Burkholderiales bacterium]|nr:class I SAM-dependent rRNA methyltransferase [Burkholderiales bacterium]
YSAASQIVARVWSWHEDAPVSTELLRQKLCDALALRRDLLPDARAARLVHGESDGLPGLVIDRYGDTGVLQASSAGAAALRGPIADLLFELAGLRNVYERSDAEVMSLEGLAASVGWLRGEGPSECWIEENGIRYAVDIAAGHKTGFYLDQRDNRALVRELAHQREVLDCFCYAGGFSLNALKGDARHVTAIDASADALAQARRNLASNALSSQRIEWLEADVFQVLRTLRDRGRRFDLIVLDPPKFAPTAALAARAARGYKDINLLAFKLLAPGGILLTFSCSGGVSRELFHKIIAAAASDAQVEAQIVRWLGAGADHPVALAFPEGDYLKGLMCRAPGEPSRTSFDRDHT